MGKWTNSTIAYGLAWAPREEPLLWRGAEHELGLQGWVADQLGVAAPAEDAAWEAYQERVRDLFERLGITVDHFGHSVHEDYEYVGVYATPSSVHISPASPYQIGSPPVVEPEWTASLKQFCEQMHIDWQEQQNRLGWWLMTYNWWSLPNAATTRMTPGVRRCP